MLVDQGTDGADQVDWQGSELQVWYSFSSPRSVMFEIRMIPPEEPSLRMARDTACRQNDLAYSKDILGRQLASKKPQMKALPDPPRAQSRSRQAPPRLTLQTWGPSQGSQPATIQPHSWPFSQLDFWSMRAAVLTCGSLPCSLT